MLMKRIGVTNNGCGVVHLVAGHFDLRVSGYCAVTGEMRSSEFLANVAKFAASHPHVFIADLDDEYENGEIELVEVTESIKYGTESLVDAYTPGQGELVWDTTRKSLTVGDGTTIGGVDIVGMSIVSDLVIESEVTNFPAASTSQFYKISDDSDAGWLGGVAGSGLYVNRGDLLYCNKTTAAGTYAQVGQYWNHLRHIISQPDGYRAVEVLTNTVVPTIVNGFYWLNDVMYKVEDSVASVVGAGSYVHPTGDGNLHVPATSTTNSGKVLTAGATAGDLTWETPEIGSTAPTYRGVVFDGGGLPIAAGKKAYFRVPNTGTIIGAYAMADVSGSIEIAVWKDTFANFPPTVADIISASAPITLSSAQKVEDLTLTGWTTAVTAGDVICMNVNALATAITWVSAGLIIQ